MTVKNQKSSTLGCTHGPGSDRMYIGVPAMMIEIPLNPITEGLVKMFNRFVESLPKVHIIPTVSTLTHNHIVDQVNRARSQQTDDILSQLDRAHLEIDALRKKTEGSSHFDNRNTTDQE